MDKIMKSLERIIFIYLTAVSILPILYLLFPRYNFSVELEFFIFFIGCILGDLLYEKLKEIIKGRII